MVKLRTMVKSGEEELQSEYTRLCVLVDILYYYNLLFFFFADAQVVVVGHEIDETKGAIGIRIESAKAKVEKESETNGPSPKIENVPSRETKDPSQRIVAVVLRNAGKF